MGEEDVSLLRAIYDVYGIGTPVLTEQIAFLMGWDLPTAGRRMNRLMHRIPGYIHRYRGGRYPTTWTLIKHHPIVMMMDAIQANRTDRYRHVVNMLVGQLIEAGYRR